MTLTFEDAAEKIKKLKSSPSNEELLEIYALYKQATTGDNNTSKPGLLDPKGRAKWNAWDAKKGTSQDQANELYVIEAEKLIAKYGI